VESLRDMDTEQLSQPVLAQTVFCGQCGEAILNTVKFCGSCGTPNAAAAMVNTVAVEPDLEPIILENQMPEAATHLTDSNTADTVLEVPAETAVFESPAEKAVFEAAAEPLESVAAAAEPGVPVANVADPVSQFTAGFQQISAGTRTYLAQQNGAKGIFGKLLQVPNQRLTVENVRAIYLLTLVVGGLYWIGNAVRTLFMVNVSYAFQSLLFGWVYPLIAVIIIRLLLESVLVINRAKNQANS